MRELLHLFTLLVLFDGSAMVASDADDNPGMGERSNAFSNSESDAMPRCNAFYRDPFCVREARPAAAASADELGRAESELIPLLEYSDPEDDPIRYLASLFEVGLIDQEALVREKTVIIAAFQTVLESSAPEIRHLLPDPANLELDFVQCFAQLENWYTYVVNRGGSERKKFMARNALQALALLNGDVSISRHSISSVASYSSYSYSSLPNTKQLFVFACRLAGVMDPSKFVVTYLAENFADHLKWQVWKKPFERHFPGILSHDELGLALAADEARGSKFVNSIAEFLRFGETLPCPVANSKELRAMKDLLKAYFNNSLERIDSITEALFMARRGHNIELFAADEINRPACAEGLYLNLVRETAAVLSGVFILDGVGVLSCV